MSALSRRAVLGGAGSCACLLAPLALPGPVRAAGPGAASIPALLDELDGLSASLARAQIDGLDWQRSVEALFVGVDVRALRAAISLDWRSVAASTRADGRDEHRLEPGELRGGPSELHFRPKLFSLQTGHAIIPHGHCGIVSVFVVLDGRFRGRHFDRLRDEPDAILIRPSDDHTFAPGDLAGISDLAANVHWFTALDDQAVLFNVSATVPERLRIFGGSAGRVYLDPDGEVLEGGVIRAPRARVSALRAKYDGSGL